MSNLNSIELPMWSVLILVNMRPIGVIGFHAVVVFGLGKETYPGNTLPYGQ
jgi:hypothetical protein